MRFDPQAVAAAMAEVAATEIMPRFRNLAAGDIRKKHGDETVTVADEAAERALAPRLRALIPGSVVVGEEGTAADSGLLNLLAGRDPVWVIDPIDGTRNFAAGKADFGVMVALVRHDEILAGWIYEPVHARAFVAERGGGAWRDGERIMRGDDAPADDKGLRGSISYLFFPDPPRERLRAKVKEGLGPPTDRSCAARIYVDIAEGRQHFVLYRNMKPWDHLPGALIVAEAGGRVAKWDHSAYRPTDTGGGILVAGNREIWARVRRFLESP
ncbi:MAG: inositol monophosphatase [Alphaproteobacteria bacterium]|nr:inositol monophosphatase [Alphaproteobacteria bacterium]